MQWVKLVLPRSWAGGGGEHVDDRAGPEVLGADVKPALQSWQYPVCQPPAAPSEPSRDP